jgi:hypothetical protein
VPSRESPPKLIAAALLVYAAASLLHHLHNAAFVADYPNMAAGLTPRRIYAAWLGATALGAAGYLGLRRYPLIGTTLLCLYGAYGLGALLHYRLAPPSAHTLTMNATIALEALMAAMLLVATLALAWRRVRRRGS